MTMVYGYEQVALETNGESGDPPDKEREKTPTPISLGANVGRIEVLV